MIVTLSLTTWLVSDFSVILCKGVKIITLHEVGIMRFFLTFCLGFLGVVNFLHSQKAQNWAGTNNGRIYFQSNSNHISTFRAPLNQSTSIHYILPRNPPLAGEALVYDNSGELVWRNVSSDIGSSSPSTGAFTTLSANGNFNVLPTGTNAGNTGEVRWFELAANGTNYSAFKAADAMAANVVYTLPSADGSNGNMLTTNGSGQLVWSPSISGSNVSATGDLTVGGNTILGNSSSDITSLNGTLRVYDSDASNYTDIKGGDGTAQIADLNFILPTDAGSNGKVLTTNGSGTLSWSTPTPDWSAPGTIGSTTPNTGAFTTLSANGALSLQPTGTGAGNTGEIRWYELAANGSNYSAFKAADAMAVNVTYTLPSADGSSGNMLTTNGSGVLSWSSSVNTTNVTASGNLAVNGNTALGDANTDVTSLKGSLRVYDTDASNYTDIKGPNGASQTVDLNLILPTNAGAANNMLITDGSGNLSWSSSVSGTNVTASGDLSVGGNTSLGDASTDVTNLKGSFRVWDNNNTHWTDIKGGDGTAQTANLNFVLPTNAGAANNMLITDGSGNLSWSSSVSGTNVTASGDLSVGGNTSLGDASTDVTNLKGSFRVWDNDNTHYTDIKGGDGTAQIANLDFILPTNAGSNGQVLSTNGSGTLSWVTATPNWAAPGTIGSTTPNSGAFTTLSASGALTSTGDILVKNPVGASAGNTGEIRWYDLDASNFTAFKAADVMGADVTYTLPAADGSSGQFLSTNGSGVLSWNSPTASNEVKIFDLTGDHYSMLKGAEQTQNITYIYPPDPPVATNQSMIATNISGGTVTLGWSAGTGNTLYRTYQKNNTAVSTGNNNSSWILIPNISVNLDKNTQYAFEAIVLADCANSDNCVTDIEIKFDGPTGSTYDALFTFPVGSTSGGYLHDITNYYDAQTPGMVFTPTSELNDSNLWLLTYKVRGYMTTSSDNTTPFKIYFRADGANNDLRVQKAYVTFDRW
jgi:hypothetical protein